MTFVIGLIAYLLVGYCCAALAVRLGQLTAKGAALMVVVWPFGLLLLLFGGPLLLMDRHLEVLEEERLRDEERRALIAEAAGREAPLARRELDA